MRVLNESTALALPYMVEDERRTITGLAEARRSQRDKEIRIGVGPLGGEVPARVLGYAACVAKLLVEDPAASHLLQGCSRITIFSSAPKSGLNDVGPMLIATAALGGALRIAGVKHPIVLEIARSDREVDVTLHPVLDPPIAQWMSAAAERHGGSIDYAFEHAANSMFGDLADQAEGRQVRVTIGGETEARFWAVRMGVRAEALAIGRSVVPSLGLILRGIAVPWYYPTPQEPPLRLLSDADIDAATAALERAANPRDGGNTGLKKEARALRRLLTSADLGGYVDAMSSVDGARHYAEQNGMDFGPRLHAAIVGGL